VYKYRHLVYLTILSLFLFGCQDRERYDSISAADKDFLEEQALVFAHYWALPPGSIGDAYPSSEKKEILIDLFEENPAAGVYFYSCVADSISALEPPNPECRR